MGRRTVKAARHIARKELSAYLDGEARRPAEVEGHLRECPECAERLRQLRALSVGLRNMAAPDVHAAFLTRIQAEVSQVRPARRRRGLLFGPVVAVAAIWVAAAIWLVRPMEPAPPPPSFHAESGGSDSFLEEGAWTGFAGIGPAFEEAPEEALLADLAYAPWFDDLARTVEADRDVEDLVLSLSEPEARALRDRLLQYVNEG